MRYIKKTMVTFLDVASAYDNVKRSILVKKLQQTNCSAKIY